MTEKPAPGPRYRVKQERNFSAHHMLIGAARMALHQAETTKRGSYYNHLTAMTLSALSIEAICNAVGKAVVNDWATDYEAMPPFSKLRFLCETLEVELKKDAEPWSSTLWLCGFRNDIAHAKPERVETDRTMTPEAYDAYHRERSASKSTLEKQVTLGNARRALRTAEAIMNAMYARVSPKKAFGLYSDSWFGSARLGE